MKNTYRIWLIVSIICELLFLFVAVICLIFDSGSRLEWALLIIGEVVISIPGDIRLIQKIKENRKEDDSKTGDGFRKP